MPRGDALTPRFGNYPIGAGHRQSLENVTNRTHSSVGGGRPVPGSTGGRPGSSVARHHRERHLARLDHAQALPGQLLDVGGVVVALDLGGELLVLLFQDRDLVLQARLLRPHREEPREHGDGREQQAGHDDGEDRGARGEPAADAPDHGVARGAHVGRLLTAAPPAYRAASPSSSSMRSSRLYFAVRSPRDGAPALIWPAFVATARSAIVVSSVSPDRWLITVPYEASCASRITSSVSVSVPIWFGFTRIAVATPS